MQTITTCPPCGAAVTRLTERVHTLLALIQRFSPPATLDKQSEKEKSEMPHTTIESLLIDSLLVFLLPYLSGSIDFILSVFMCPCFIDHCLCSELFSLLLQVFSLFPSFAVHFLHLLFVVFRCTCFPFRFGACVYFLQYFLCYPQLCLRSCCPVCLLFLFSLFICASRFVFLCFWCSAIAD